MTRLNDLPPWMENFAPDGEWGEFNVCRCYSKLAETLALAEISSRARGASVLYSPVNQRLDADADRKGGT